MSSRKLSATIDDKQNAEEKLSALFFDGTDDDESGIYLHDYLENRSPGIEKIIASDQSPGSSEMPNKELPKILVDMYGSELFAGEHGANLRDLIFEKLFAKKHYQKILDVYLASSSSNSNTIQDMKVEFAQNPEKQARLLLNDLKNNRKKHRWVSGGIFARKFVETIRLPDIFAGIRSDPPSENVVRAVPRADIKDLENFQKNMKCQLVKILDKTSDERRAIVTLPTGAGKTRVTVEAIVDHLNKVSTDRNVLWIAQSQEVCEQAVLCFKQIWEEKGKGELLNIFRVWGKNNLPTSDEHGIIVGGYQKLISRKNQLHHLSDYDSLSAVFIDEAHHSVAFSYGEILKHIGMSAEISGEPKPHDTIPLIGLTATPERSIPSETKKLHRMFGSKRIYPHKSCKPTADGKSKFGDKWEDLLFMKERLTEQKYLAKAEFHEIDLDKVHKLTSDETQKFQDGDDEWMQSIATDEQRNGNIKREILKWANEGKKILYFGTNVTQSNAMAHLLERDGIRSVCITGETRYAARKLLVESFNEKNNNSIQVMCNYNVLSTGFDSPQIDVVIIARPTTSVVAYQQMVGRGLRGEKFCGKVGNHCDIVTVKDNIVKFNDDRIELGWKKYQSELSGVKISTKKIKTQDSDKNTFSPSIPIQGDGFTTDEISKKFGVQNRGGIRFTHKHKFVILIDSEESNFENSVNKEKGIISYDGTGEEDQSFDVGMGHFNAKVRDSNSTLLYFQKPAGKKYIFKYSAKYKSHTFSTAKNRTGMKREIIKFKLKIIKKLCPRCKEVFASNDDEIKEKFGYRTTGEKTIPQSWCRNCRNQ